MTDEAAAISTTNTAIPAAGVVTIKAVTPEEAAAQGVWLSMGAAGTQSSCFGCVCVFNLRHHAVVMQPCKGGLGWLGLVAACGSATRTGPASITGGTRLHGCAATKAQSKHLHLRKCEPTCTNVPLSTLGTRQFALRTSMRCTALSAGILSFNDRIAKDDGPGAEVGVL